MRRIQLTMVTAGLLLLIAVHSFMPVSPPTRQAQAPAIVQHEEPKQQAEQIGGTTSWRREEDEPISAPVVSAITSTTSSLSSKTLQCPTYAGPMYFPHSHPTPVKRRAVRAAALPEALEEQPTSKSVAVHTLLPFELSSVRLAPSSRFHDAQRTNAAFLRLLDPDRLLYFFRRLANLPQPRLDIIPYGGWESGGSGLRGEFAGHFLHAAAAVAVASDDALLRSRCEIIVKVLEECQGSDGYLSAFSRAEFETVEDFKSKYPWVPYYVIHKLMAGLLSAHELLGSARALRVAERLASHIHVRVHRLTSKGLDVWHDFINQEVGGMSEALADLARVTKNSTYLQLSAMFERPCFVGALARGDQGGAAEAIERVHANTHLPQILGSMARYEATGDPSLRQAAEAFWRELSTQHTFATGGSTTGEIWLRAGMLGDAVAPQRKENYWAHDQAETCVAHNSMRISRRLLQWSELVDTSAWDRPLQHATYYERTLYNAVLGTQRGSEPGEMLYMMPLGSGVSKAGIDNAPQGHHWSNAENHFWCCQGSGIEAFARLADSIYWRRKKRTTDGSSTNADEAKDAHHLLVLQLLPSSLKWDEAGIRVDVHGDYPGSVSAGAPLRVSLKIERTAGATSKEAIAVGVRLPSWASKLNVRSTPNGALAIAEPAPAKHEPGSLLKLSFGVDAASGGSSGGLEIEMQPQISWERIKDSRPQFQSLHACLYGPLVLAGLTYAERALPHDATLLPIPPSERSNLASLRVVIPEASTDKKGGDAGVIAGCLVKRWSSVWMIRPDRTRHFLLKPAEECMGRATPIEDSLSGFPQAHGGGKGYALDATQTTSACALLDGCVLPAGTSAFADGRLFIMHAGVAGKAAGLAAPPPLVSGGPRKGGTDAANAATWRLTTSPIGLENVATTSSGGGGGVSKDEWFFIESFDMPGHVLAPSKNGNLGLERVDAKPANNQMWRKGGANGGIQNKGGGTLGAQRRVVARRRC